MCIKTRKNTIGLKKYRSSNVKFEVFVFFRNLIEELRYDTALK